MTCSYCRARNDADAHRCVRCGRRMGEDDGRRFPVQPGAVAPQLDRAERAVPVEGMLPRQGPRLVTELPKSTAEGSSDATPVQPSLWGPMVVERAPATKPSRPAVRSSGSAALRRGQSHAQEAFDWSAIESAGPVPGSRKQSHGCQTGVAATGHRVLAAGVDLAVPVLLFGVLLGAAHAVASDLTLNQQALPFYAASILLLSLFYRLIYCLGDADTLGMQFAGLRLVTLDGRRPGRGRRVQRMLSGWVSFCSAGMGLLWALLDEERLAWHDHMSGTFPAREAEEDVEG